MSLLHIVDPSHQSITIHSPDVHARIGNPELCVQFEVHSPACGKDGNMTIWMHLTKNQTAELIQALQEKMQPGTPFGGKLPPPVRSFGESSKR
jgi:hypothetical protein